MYHVIVGVQTYQKYLKDEKILIYQFSFCRKSVECLIKKYETRIPTYIYEMLWFFFQVFHFRLPLFYKNVRNFNGSLDNFGRSDGDMIYVGKKWWISNKCICGFMPNSHKKIWMLHTLAKPIKVSRITLKMLRLATVFWFSDCNYSAFCKSLDLLMPT